MNHLLLVAAASLAASAAAPAAAQSSSDLGPTVGIGVPNAKLGVPAATFPGPGQFVAAPGRFHGELVRHHRGRHGDGERRRRHRDRDDDGVILGGWGWGGDWAYFNNRSFQPDSYNDWWHDRPDRAYPRWVQRQRGKACTQDRMWWSGGGWTC